METTLSAAPLSRGVEPRASAARVYRLDARSIDALFLHRLKVARFHGRVHSLFDKVVNLEGADGELFTLACRELDNAPNTIVVDIGGYGSSGMALNDRVSGSAGTLSVGDGIEIALASASAWQGRLPAYPGSAGGLSTQLRFARSWLARHGEGGGMVAPHSTESAFACAVAATLGHRSACLLEALARGDLESACGHAKSMIGLGPGLTPSGDDFLVGLFAVLHIAGSPCHGWLGSGKDVVAGAERATNAISFAALSQAADGRVRESIVTLIEGLLHGAAEDLVGPLGRVLAIGSTSGTDIVAGILSALQLNLQVGATRALQTH